jgi:hypothetical protein
MDGSIMPISYHIDDKAAVIFENWTGDVHSKDLKDYWNVYLRTPEVLAIRRTLVDLRESNICFTGEELCRLIESVALPLLNGMDWKTAIIVQKATQYGFSRQYQVFAELYSNDAIFYKLDEALHWLLTQKLHN